MEELKKFKNLILIRMGVVGELIKTLWKHKLWWALPIVLIILFLTMFLLVVGYSGVGVFLYPLI